MNEIPIWKGTFRTKVYGRVPNVHSVIRVRAFSESEAERLLAQEFDKRNGLGMSDYYSVVIEEEESEVL